jgi:hypothetical protein
MQMPELTAFEMWLIVDALEDRANILGIDKIWDGVAEIEKIIDKFPDKDDLLTASLED